jgi:hypothetical protein
VVLAVLLAFYPALNFSNTGTFNLCGFFGTHLQAPNLISICITSIKPTEPIMP